MSKKTLNKKALLEKAKKLNICGRTKVSGEDLQEGIKELIIKYNEIIFGAVGRYICK